MGKRIRAQRIGRGSPTYKADTFKRIGPIKYPPLSAQFIHETIKGKLVDIVHEHGRCGPIGILEINGERYPILVSEGSYVGQIIEIGERASLSIGNILPLKAIPEGTFVFNIERRRGDGGKLVRSTGAYATVIGRSGSKVLISLPSGKTIALDENCLATIGIAAGGGRVDKPFLKAGTKHYFVHARKKKWPRVRGVAMNPVDHPFGGGSHQSPGKPTTVSRHAPPGRKVGLISAKKTGRGGKRK
ncbi:MAG: 50S ribosomal protein L2 [Thaumarchaeota archaeon]|nr:MAG: 50S ribosomal protein L2 [Nitrososphaerota archaeon]RLG65497.1 MAG: 50S ribosomal protein L2 [archaeon]RLG66152.1 MAG: 50S ribosomal protein L2 [archaeon]HDM23618.1 50S ribosomal protein L2 [Candidatus Bathyarchaeota archaeon]